MQAIRQIIINEDKLTALAVAAFRALGVNETQSKDTAQILVLADTMGLHTHGVSRVLSYGDRLKIGGINPAANITVDQVAPAIALVDGDNGLGPAIGIHALNVAMTMARQTGIAMVLCRGSNHFGPITPYAWLAAQQNFASLIASNATTTIAPTGGQLARLGNNPLGFGFPNPSGDPIILDMAMSVVARAKIRDAAKAGHDIPDSWATDATGRPTTDPTAALKGLLQPIGGYKGYGLSLCVDLMAGMLSGAAYLTHVKSWVDEPEIAQNLGHSMILIDSSCLMTTKALSEKMTDFQDILHNTPRIDPDVSVALPGEREIGRLRESRSSGIAMSKEVIEALIAMTRQQC